MTTLNSKTIFISICISFNSSDWSSQWKVCSLALHVHLVLQGWVTSGRSRGGTREPNFPVFLGKKREETTEGRKADRASKTKPPLPPPVAQDLDPPLVTALICQRHQTHRTLFNQAFERLKRNREKDCFPLPYLFFTRRQWHFCLPAASESLTTSSHT